MTGEGEGRLIEAGHRIVIKLHPEADRGRNPDLRRHRIARSGVGDRDRGHTKAGNIAHAGRGGTRPQLGAAGKSDRRRAGVIGTPRDHDHAGHEPALQHGGGRRSAAATTADAHRWRHRIGFGTAGDSEAGCAQSTQSCRRLGTRAAGRRRHGHDWDRHIARSADRHGNGADLTAAINHTGGSGTYFLVRSAINPVVSLTVLKGELGVRIRGVGASGRVTSNVHFVIFRLLAASDGQWQCKQRSKRLQLGSRDGVVRQWIVEGFTHDLIDIHARPLVGRAGVGQQHKRFGGGGGIIEVIAKRVGAAGEYQRVFLIGIKTRLGGVILIINAARLLRESEIPRADSRGHHDLRFARRIDDRVFPHFGW